MESPQNYYWAEFNIWNIEFYNSKFMKDFKKVKDNQYLSDIEESDVRINDLELHSAGYNYWSDNSEHNVLEFDLFLKIYFGDLQFLIDPFGFEFKCLFEVRDYAISNWRYKHVNHEDYVFYSKIKLTGSELILSDDYTSICSIKKNNEENYMRVLKSNPPVEVISHILGKTNNPLNLLNYITKDINEVRLVGKAYYKIDGWGEADTETGKGIYEYQYTEDIQVDNPEGFVRRKKAFQNCVWEKNNPFINYTEIEENNILDLIDEIHKEDPCNEKCWHLREYYNRISLELASQTEDPFIFLVSFSFAKILQRKLILPYKSSLLSELGFNNLTIENLQ